MAVSKLREKKKKIHFLNWSIPKNLRFFYSFNYSIFYSVLQNFSFQCFEVMIVHSANESLVGQHNQSHIFPLELNSDF